MSADDVSAVFAERITARLVDLKRVNCWIKIRRNITGAGIKDPQMSMTLDASQDPAGIKRRSNLAEIYLVRDEQNRCRKWCCPSTATACGQ